MYTVGYFIKKFEAIPENLWCVSARSNNDQRCAYGWCYTSKEEAKQSEAWGYQRNAEEIALDNMVQLLNPLWGAAGINNGIYSEYQQPTPKKRILAALHDIKAMQEKEQPQPERIKTVYVSVPETVKEQSKELILS